jgi:hypothetical protein
VHSSNHEAAKKARADGTQVATFARSDLESLEQTLEGLLPYVACMSPGIGSLRWKA